MGYSFGEKSRAALAGVYPPLVKVLEAAIVNSPYDFRINEGVRSLVTQQRYYAQGRTKPGPIITKADGVKNKSNHQKKADGYGHAVDLYPFIDTDGDGDKEVSFTDEAVLAKIAAHIKATGVRLGTPVVWGGDWKTIIDKPHFEML